MQRPRRRKRGAEPSAKAETLIGPRYHTKASISMLSCPTSTADLIDDRVPIERSSLPSQPSMNLSRAVDALVAVAMHDDLGDFLTWRCLGA